MKKLLPVIQMAQLLVKNKLLLGGDAVDATAGNGNDSLFLCKYISANSTIHIFDIQQTAIDNTKDKLKKYTELDIRYYCIGHQYLSNHVDRAQAIMFNLGYLPNSDSKIITIPSTTIQAISQGLDILCNNGIITVVLYPGHVGGDVEAKAVEDYCFNLSSKYYNVILYKTVNRKDAPYLIAIEKKI